MLPCIEAYQKVDLRTITLGVPPQEVSIGQAMMMDNHKRTLTLSSTKFPILNSKWRYMIISLLGEKLSCGQVLTKDSVTVSVDAVVYYRCNQLCHRAVTYFSTCDGDDVLSFPDPLFK